MRVGILTLIFGNRRMEKTPQSPIIAQIKEILSGIDDSLEDEDKLSMVGGLWKAE